MIQHYYLVAYLFRIPFKFLIVPYYHDFDDFIVLNNVIVKSSLNYFSEDGNIRFQTSETMNLKTGIVLGMPKKKHSNMPRITYLSGKSEVSIGSSNVKDNGKGNNSDNHKNRAWTIFDEKILNNAPISGNRQTNQPFININEHINLSREHNYPHNNNEEPNTYFITSRFNFLILENIFNLNDKFELRIQYTEAKKTPFILNIMLHIPLLVTSILVVIIILTFDTDIDKDTIKLEISKLPSQKYNPDLKFHECTICLDKFLNNQDVRVLNCNHCFHKSCIDSWLLNILKCPLCRSSVTELADTSRYQTYQITNT